MTRPLEELVAEYHAAAASDPRSPDLLERFRPLFWRYPLDELRRVLDGLGDSDADRRLAGIIGGEQPDRGMLEEADALPRVPVSFGDDE